MFGVDGTVTGNTDSAGTYVVRKEWHGGMKVASRVLERGYFQVSSWRHRYTGGFLPLHNLYIWERRYREEGEQV